MVPATGAVVGGKYELVRVLASGGMGSVWLARHSELDVDVAVKFMQPEQQTTAQAEARFKREARSAAKLKSPHIVQIHDYGISDGTAYMVMELLEGQDLASLIEREGRLSPSRASEICAQACKGLELAHEAGIVHRDLKPSNIFLARSGKDEIIKILDFGIAKDTALPAVTTDRTASGVILGSPHYMSPEQARGAPVDARSDLWSMAVVLYEMLTGDHPFEAQHLGELIARILYEPYVAPSTLVPGLGTELDAFFTRALARPAAARFQSAAQLAGAFAEAAAQARGLIGPTPARRQGSRDEATLDQVAQVVPTGRAAITAHGTQGDAPQRRRAAPLPWLVGGGVLLVGALGVGVWRLSPREQAVSDAAAASIEPRPTAAPPDVSAAPSPTAQPTEPVLVVSPAPSSVPTTAASARSEPLKPGAPQRPAPPPVRSSTPKAPPASTVDPDFGLPVSKP